MAIRRVYSRVDYALINEIDLILHQDRGNLAALVLHLQEEILGEMHVCV